MPKNAQAIEAADEAAEESEATVTYKGCDFTFPLSQLDWSVDALEAFEEGKGTTIVRELVTPAQWHAFKDTRPTGRDINAVTDLIAVRLGFKSAPESPASSV